MYDTYLLTYLLWETEPSPLLELGHGTVCHQTLSRSATVSHFSATVVVFGDVAEIGYSVDRLLQFRRELKKFYLDRLNPLFCFSFLLSWSLRFLLGQH